MTSEYLGSSFVLLFCIIFCSLLCANGQLQDASSTEPLTVGSARLSKSTVVAITLSLSFTIVIASAVIIFGIWGVMYMRTRQDSKLKGIRMRLRRGRRKQSSVRGTNSDDISVEGNICYDSVIILPMGKVGMLPLK